MIPHSPAHYSRCYLIFWSSSNKEIRVEIQPIRAAGALTIDMWLPVHGEHAVPSIAVDNQLVPSARLDRHSAGDDACPRARVEPGKEQAEEWKGEFYFNQCHWRREGTKGCSF